MMGLGSCHEWKQTPTEELVEPILHGKYLTDLNPNRKAATKGGSMPWNFRFRNSDFGIMLGLQSAIRNPRSAIQLPCS